MKSCTAAWRREALAGGSGLLGLNGRNGCKEESVHTRSLLSSLDYTRRSCLITKALAKKHAGNRVYGVYWIYATFRKGRKIFGRVEYTVMAIWLKKSLPRGWDSMLWPIGLQKNMAVRCTLFGSQHSGSCGFSWSLCSGRSRGRWWSWQEQTAWVLALILQTFWTLASSRTTGAPGNGPGRPDGSSPLWMSWTWCSTHWPNCGSPMYLAYT